MTRSRLLRLRFAWRVGKSISVRFCRSPRYRIGAPRAIRGVRSSGGLLRGLTVGLTVGLPTALNVRLPTASSDSPARAAQKETTRLAWSA